MVRKVMRWSGMILGSLAGLVVLTAIILYFVGGIMWKKVYENYDIPVESVNISTGEAAISRGQHIATIHFCAVCHGENLAGRVMLDAPALVVAYAPNLTPGVGGVGSTNTDEDWVRAIRHGVGHDGRGLVGMPARVWYHLSDEDLGALIVYLKSLSPVNNVQPKQRIGPLDRMMLVFGQFPATEAAMIGHTALRPPSPEPGLTIAYGEYLAQSTCRACMV